MLRTRVIRSKRSQRREDTGGAQPEIQNEHDRARSCRALDFVTLMNLIGTIAQRSHLCINGVASVAPRRSVDSRSASLDRDASLMEMLTTPFFGRPQA